MSELAHLLQILFYMLTAHALCDYPLQGDWLSKAKNPTLDLVPGERIWPMALSGHALIHAAAVQIITGSWLLFAIEAVAHGLIDYSKCKGLFGYNADQYLHIVCKLTYVICIAGLGTLP